MGFEVVVVFSSGSIEEDVAGGSGLGVVVVAIVVVVLVSGNIVVVGGDVVEFDFVVGLVGGEVEVVVRVVVVRVVVVRVVVVIVVVVRVVVVDLGVDVFGEVDLGPGPEVVISVTFDLLDGVLFVAEVVVGVRCLDEVLLDVVVGLVLMAGAELVGLGVLSGEVVVGAVSFTSRLSISSLLMKKCKLHTCIPSMLSKRSSYVMVILLPVGAVRDLVVVRVSLVLEGLQTVTIFADTFSRMVIP